MSLCVSSVSGSEKLGLGSAFPKGEIMMVFVYHHDVIDVFGWSSS